MSMPEFPSINPPLTREDAVNQIISSIAMEELALSHIINAEGEKLQYVLGTIPGSTGPQPTIEQILDVNESIRAVLQSAAETQSVLRAKLQTALAASTMRGPTGPTGPAGEPGVVESTSYQIEMLNAMTMVNPQQNFMFNTVVYSDDTDITYDQTTGTFNLNQSGGYDYYVITYWYFSEGYGDEFPYEVAIKVNGADYSILTVHFPEAQITNTVIVPTTGPTTMTLTNISDAAISLPDQGTQAKMTIVGYKS